MIIGIKNACADEISEEFENGSCWLKTRSQGQILEKPCVCSKGHNFSPIIMKPSQIVCLDKTWDKFDNGSCRVKN